MKQVLTPEDINFLEDRLKGATPGPWSVMSKSDVDTVWVVPSVEGNPIALFDYRSGTENKANAEFVVSARNYVSVMLNEIKSLRKRVLDLIQSNNFEVQKRMDLQSEIDELKKMLKDSK